MYRLPPAWNPHPFSLFVCHLKTAKRYAEIREVIRIEKRQGFEEILIVRLFIGLRLI
jgi:hypothetical protein